MKQLNLKSQSVPYLVFACLALAGAAVLVIHSIQLWTFTVDDAFITFRYAKNLAAGFGPVFNTTGAPAEGYTSILWMLVMAVPNFLHYGVESYAKVLGILATLGTMGWIAFFLWRVHSPTGRNYRILAAGLVILFFGLLPETALHAVSGMETAVYTFLLTGGVTLTYLAVKGEKWPANWLPIAALLTGLMRPEANLIAGILLAWVWFNSPQKKGFLLRTGLLYLLPGAVYFLWRWNFYGVLFPLPYYIKTTAAGIPGLGIAVPFLAFLMGNLGLYIGIGLFSEKKAVIILLLAMLPDITFFLFSRPIMDYNFRFLFPFLPSALVLAGMGLLFLMDRIAAWPGLKWGWIAPGSVVFFSLLMFLGQNVPRTTQVFSVAQDYARGMAQVHHVIGKILYQVPHSGTSPILAVTDAGAIPYFSEWTTLDIGGLNDPAIALDRVQFVDYVFSQNPEVMVLSSTSLAEFKQDSARKLNLYQRALEMGMAVVAKAPTYQGDSMWVLARPGSSAAQRLMAQFEFPP